MERTDLDQWRSREVARLLALVETQRRYYQDMVASIPVGLLVLSADLRIQLSNTAARKILDLQVTETPRRIDTILPPVLLDRIEEVLESGTPQTGIIIETGREKRLRVGIQLVRNWDAEATQEALLTIEDLSDVSTPSAAPAPEAETQGAPEVAVAANQSVAATSAQQFIDNSDAILWAVELPSMKFVFASRQSENLLGFAPEHWTSHATFWWDRIADVDRNWVIRSYQHAIETGQPQSVEFQAVTASGSVIWLREHARLIPATAEQPQYMVGIAIDATERRMLEDQLLQSERVEAVARLASRVSHDLNNMLMILTGYSEELLSNLPAGSNLRADVQEIFTAADRMSGLANQLLSFARRPTGAAAEMDLESALERFRPRLSALLGTHLSVEFQMSPQPSRVRADMAQLEQVMVAIIERARQPMHAGEKIVIETSAVEFTENLRRPTAPLQPGTYAVVLISAPGQPLDPDARAAMFECSIPGKEPWDDVAATLSRAYGIVRQWGGDISVSRGPESETQFRVFLPRVEPVTGETAAPIAAVEAPAAPEQPTPLATILVVEDEAGIRALVRKILRRQGYEVLEAVNGQDALALCRETGRQIDLLITDVLMPQMGGRELVERLQSQGHQMKVLYVSGYTDDTTVYSGELPPGTAFLQKPFTLGSLLDKVKEVLAK